MKKNRMVLVSSVVAFLAFAASCTQDGDKYYLLNKTTTVAAEPEEDMEQVFSIADFKEKQEAKFYLKSLTEPLSVQGDQLAADIYIPVDAADNAYVEDVPYVDFKNYHENIFFIKSGIGSDVHGEMISAGKVRFYNPQNEKYYVEFDADNQTIYFNDYDAFSKTSVMGTIVDMTNEAVYLKRTQNIFERYGSSITVSLKKYGIPMKVIGEKVLIPLQVYNDIFNGPIPSFIYNNGDLYFQSAIENNPEYFDSNSGSDTRSDVLKKLNYNALCMNMDFNYGLKDIHGISNFVDFFEETGLIKYFSASATAAAFTRGLDEMCCNYFADFHSSFNLPSYYTGSYTRPDDLIINPIYKKQRLLMTSYKSIRAGVFESKGYDVHVMTGTDKFMDYAEFDNTAYITFDNFFGAKKDYFALTAQGTQDLNEEDVEDTVGLVIYAQQQIKNNPAIKNVVIDLSTNGGGELNALAYISAWYLGESTINIKSSLTGAMGSTSYLIDTNFDGNHSVSDTLQGLKDSGRELNLYCITSPMSFSCGNALPAIFKDSGKVVLIGKKSGGGSCVVCNGSSADGNIFQVSSFYQMCTTKNGSFYQADEGIEPDFIISDFTNVYDRETLTLYINNLL